MIWAQRDFKAHLNPSNTSHWIRLLLAHPVIAHPGCWGQGKPWQGAQVGSASQAPPDPPNCCCSHQPYFISFMMKTSPRIRACVAQPAGTNLCQSSEPLKSPSKVKISRRKTVKLSRQAIFPSMNAEIREEGGFSLSSTGRFSLGKSQTCCQLCSADKRDFQQGEKNLVWGFRFKLLFLG